MPDFPAAEPLSVSTRGLLAIVTINRPDARNAINGAVARGLSRAIAAIDSDDNIRVAILTGTGDRSFCAGADLAEIAAGRGSELNTPEGGFAGFVQAKRKKPWIAAVDAPALGGGLELCLACDLIVASKRARFGLPEVKRGIFAGAGGVFRLPRAVPRHVALEMIATGEPITAERAFAVGLINRICDDGEALNEAMKLAESISANAPLSVQGSLELARKANDLSEMKCWTENSAIGRRIMASADAKEGPRAFLDKRAPNWTGS